MAWPPQAVRELAHALYAPEPMGQERSAGSRLYPVTTGSDPPREARSRGVGQYYRQGPPGWDGGIKKNGPQALGRSRGGWTTKIHLVAADARTVLTFALSPGQAHDTPQGRKLLHRFGKRPRPIPLLMDRAYEGDETRQLAVELGYVPVVPPKDNRCTPWDYDRALYTRRNEIERLFRRFDKLDVMFVAFINFA
jgi:transposase